MPLEDIKEDPAVGTEDAARTPRRVGREVALQVLYALDMQPGLNVELALNQHYRALQGEPQESADLPALSESEALSAQRFAAELVRGVHGDREAVDEVITGCSRNWRLSRMTWVDRNVLRLATYELRATRDVPARVVLNEAIELARRFGTTESAAFVNGVLDRVLAALGRRPRPARRDARSG